MFGNVAYRLERIEALLRVLIHKEITMSTALDDLTAAVEDEQDTNQALLAALVSANATMDDLAAQIAALAGSIVDPSALSALAVKVQNINAAQKLATADLLATIAKDTAPVPPDSAPVVVDPNADSNPTG